jgi:hypothetical protein
MRIFLNFEEARNEIQRDLAEMGTSGETVKLKTMQNKNIEGIEGFETYELLNYQYTVLQPHVGDLDRANKKWCLAEWAERLAGIEGNPVNPGEAYLIREKVWKEFLNVNFKFDYTYSERLGFLPNDLAVAGKKRVPCTLGYHFIYRGGKLHCTYFMRSCDFITHYQNDLYLCKKLLDYVAGNVGVNPGQITHTVNSLHCYKKDVQGVF